MHASRRPGETAGPQHAGGVRAAAQPYGPSAIKRGGEMAGLSFRARLRLAAVSG
jgi:hypothetical protein